MSENASGEAVADTEQSYKELLEDPEWLFHQYRERGLSYKEIGDMLDVTGSTVWRYAKKHDIESRSYGEFQVSDDRLKNPDWLYQKYAVEDLSSREIADECGCSPDSVNYWRRKHDIEAKQKNTPVDARLDNREWLVDKYVNEQLTIRDIAELVGENFSNVRRRLIRYGINRRDSGFQRGENNHNWLGGHPRYYGPNWEEQRRKALNRDDGECQSCGISREDVDKDLHVHHVRRIMWFKENLDAPEWYEKGNRLENLVSLCNTCHAEWEGIPLRPQ